MSVKSIAELKELCEKLGIAPSKMRGQNFLVDEEVLNEIITAAELTANDTVLEIGPGFGALLEELIKRAGRVVAVELDRKIFSWLQGRFKGIKNLELIQGDILKLLDGLTVKWLTPLSLVPPFAKGGTGDDDSLAEVRGSYKVVANLPYQITSRILWELLAADNPPSEIIVMVQKEVGERICAKPGKMSVLAVAAQYYSEPEIVKVARRESFWPVPEVESVILKLKTQDTKDNFQKNFKFQILNFTINSKSKIQNVRKIYEEEFFRLVKIGFSSKRKMLKNNLENVFDKDKVGMAMKETGLGLKIRAEGLAIEEWAELFRRLTTDNKR